VNSQTFSWVKSDLASGSTVQCANDASANNTYRFDGSLHLYPTPDIQATWTSAPPTLIECSGIEMGDAMQPYNPALNWQLQLGTSYADAEDVVVQGVSADQCKASCLNSAGCLGFVLDASQNCAQKTALGSPVATPGSDAYLLTTKPMVSSTAPVWANAAGYDFPGNDLGSMPGSADDCQAVCPDISGCVGFVYDPSGQTCAFKSVLNSPTPSSTAQTYFMNAAMSWTVKADTDFPGNDLNSLTVGSVTECQTACTTAPNCKGFTYNPADGQCTTKTDVSTSASAPGLEGYIKTPAAIVASTNAADLMDVPTSRPLFDYFLKKKLNPS
jgi:hypothetical protein